MVVGCGLGWASGIVNHERAVPRRWARARSLPHDHTSLHRSVVRITAWSGTTRTSKSVPGGSNLLRVCAPGCGGD